MDWQALLLSFKLAFLTSFSLLPVGLFFAWLLTRKPFQQRYWLEVLITLPLVLPPTVLGYFLLTMMDKQAWLGGVFYSLTGQTLAFSFTGLWLASMVYSLPFAVQPMLRAFEQIGGGLRQAAWCSGLSPVQTLLKIELPLAWPGILTAWILTFSHTLGEFGVVLMVGGNIAGETRTLSIAIYDSVLSFQQQQAWTMSWVLLLIALVTLTMVYKFNMHARLLK